MPTSRKFPKELDELAFQVNTAYVDTAKSVNDRSIGIYPSSSPGITGNKWYINAGKVQSELRRVYTFTTTASIDHHIDLDNIDLFSDMYGTYTDGTNWYGLIAGSNVAIAGQISFYITPTQIVFLTGAGAPPVTADFSGSIVLAWISPG